MLGGLEPQGFTTDGNVMVQKKYILLAAVLTIALLYVSCMQHYRWEVYHRASVEYEWGSIQGSLTGEDREERGLKLRASPYHVHLLFSMNEQPDSGRIIVTNLELVDITGKKAFSHPGPLSNSFRSYSNTVGIRLDPVDLPYVDYWLRFNVEIQLENKIIRTWFEEPLKTDVREWENLSLPIPPA